MMITSGIKAQYTMGTTGMMNIPTAEMQQTGTFMIGGNYLPEELNPFKYNSGNYFVNITFFSFLELNYRCILLKSDYMAKKPKFNQQDRSLSVRLRPLKEGKYWPAIVIGSNDPFKDKGTPENNRRAKPDDCSAKGCTLHRYYVRRIQFIR